MESTSSSRPRDFPREQSTLFLVKGGELTLRDCSITVVGPLDRVFTLVQVGAPGPIPDGAGPPRVILERTSVRGPALRAFHFAGGPAEVVVDRSVILCGGSPAIASEGQAAARSRKLFIVRSILASQGPLVDPGRDGAVDPGPGVEPGSRRRPRLVAAGGGSRGVDGEPPRPPRLFRLRPRTGRLVPLDDVRDGPLGPGRRPRRRPIAVAGDRVGKPPSRRRLARLDPRRGSHPRRACEPRRGAASHACPGREAEPEALGQGRRAVPPSVDPRAGRTATDPGRGGPGVDEGRARRQSPRPTFCRLPARSPLRRRSPRDPSRSPNSRSTRGDPKWNGDLGVFLRSSIQRENRLVRVRVRGSGVHRCTSIRLEPGLSLEVTVEPGPAGSPPLTWVAGSDDPLIGVRSADLTLTGVHLVGDAGGSTRTLIRVEDGVLTFRRGSLAAPWSTSGTLVSLRGTGSKPLKDRLGEPKSRIDRPVARFYETVLQTGGVAISADLGRGVVGLDHCLINVGLAAFDLRPQGVRRDRFEADLWLDRCTIASERDVVRFGSWPGEAPGPDRPWLVSSRESAFLDAYDRPVQDDVSVLLRVDAQAMGQGAVAWQSSGDVYDWTHFAVAGDGRPPANPRPDVQHQWVDLWGRNHVSNASGPGLNGVKPRVRPVVGRIHLGGVRPGDLALEHSRAADAKKPINVGVDFKALGISPSASNQPKPR